MYLQTSLEKQCHRTTLLEKKKIGKISKIIHTAEVFVENKSLSGGWNYFSKCIKQFL